MDQYEKNLLAIALGTGFATMSLYLILKAQRPKEIQDIAEICKHPYTTKSSVQGIVQSINDNPIIIKQSTKSFYLPMDGSVISSLKNQNYDDGFQSFYTRERLETLTKAAPDIRKVEPEFISFCLNDGTGKVCLENIPMSLIQIKKCHNFSEEISDGAAEVKKAANSSSFYKWLDPEKTFQNLLGQSIFGQAATSFIVVNQSISINEGDIIRIDFNNLKNLIRLTNNNETSIWEKPLLKLLYPQQSQNIQVTITIDEATLDARVKPFLLAAGLLTIFVVGTLFINKKLKERQPPAPLIVDRQVQDERTDDPQIACVVCLVNRRRIVYSCGHFVVCQKCNQEIHNQPRNLQRCPLCRANIESAVLLFN